MCHVSLHLDHAYEKESIIRAIESGFTSVMYDGSKYDLNENIRRTKEIVDLAHQAGVSVEAEIGSLARGAFSDEEEGDGTLTDPQSAKQFVAATEVDFLALRLARYTACIKGSLILTFRFWRKFVKLLIFRLSFMGGLEHPMK